MMAAILNSAMLDSDTVILDSDTLLSSLRFTQKHSHSTLTLTQTNSIWLIWDVSHLEFCHLGLSHFEQKKTSFIHSHSTSWWQPSSKKIHSPSWIQPICNKKNFTHSFWLNLMMAAILNSAMLDSDTAILDSDTLLSSLRFTQNTLTPLWLWLKLIQSDSNSFILT